MKDALIKPGKFVSHSGIQLSYKIECDALTDADIECIASIIADKTDFGIVEGIPTGGCRLADALEQYAVFEAPFNTLIVDDVFTTGVSMEAAKTAQPPQVPPDDVVGWVIFARSILPDWINAIFTTGEMK